MGKCFHPSYYVVTIMLLGCVSLFAGGIDFTSRPLCAGRALLTEDGLIFHYTYDAFGNRTQLQISGKSSAAPIAENRAYDQFGRLICIESSAGKNRV